MNQESLIIKIIIATFSIIVIIKILYPIFQSAFFHLLYPKKEKEGDFDSLIRSKTNLLLASFKENMTEGQVKAISKTDEIIQVLKLHADQENAKKVIALINDSRWGEGEHISKICKELREVNQQEISRHVITGMIGEIVVSLFNNQEELEYEKIINHLKERLLSKQ